MFSCKGASAFCYFTDNNTLYHFIKSGQKRRSRIQRTGVFQTNADFKRRIKKMKGE